MNSKELILCYNSEEQGPTVVRACIQRLFKVKNEEFVLLSGGQKIKLDQLDSINGITL